MAEQTALGFRVSHFHAEESGLSFDPGIDAGEGFEDVGIFRGVGEFAEAALAFFQRAEGFAIALPILELRGLEVDDLGPAKLLGEDFVDALEEGRGEHADDSEGAIDGGEVGELHGLGDATDLVAKAGDFIEMPAVGNPAKESGDGKVLDDLFGAGEVGEVVFQRDARRGRRERGAGLGSGGATGRGVRFHMRRILPAGLFFRQGVHTHRRLVGCE